MLAHALVARRDPAVRAHGAAGTLPSLVLLLSGGHSQLLHLSAPSFDGVALLGETMVRACVRARELNYVANVALSTAFVLLTPGTRSLRHDD